jgi:hypothetical protein
MGARWPRVGRNAPIQDVFPASELGKMDRKVQLGSRDVRRSSGPDHNGSPVWSRNCRTLAAACDRRCTASFFRIA